MADLAFPRDQISNLWILLYLSRMAGRTTVIRKWICNAPYEVSTAADEHTILDPVKCI